jgi:D-glycero-alpha-D-manno-heptose-7-phosphate kinase
MGRIGELLHENWMLKRTLTNGISNTQIDRWYSAAMKKGALGGKIIGAGGGGFLMVFAPPKKQKGIKDALSSLRQVPIEFELQGSRIVYAE